MASELIYRGGHESPHQSSGHYSPKPLTKHWASTVASARPIRYLLAEQRLLFVLVGVALATVFFLLFSFPSSPTSSYSGQLGHTYNFRSSFDDFESYPHHKTVALRESAGGFNGKVPLGLKRKVLRVVVTGGAGFVGSHLVDRLIERGDSVIVVDNFFTGRKENVMHHFGNPRFEMIRHDVVEPILLEVDQIYHLACPASPVHYKFNPVKTIISLLFLVLC